LVVEEDHITMDQEQILELEVLVVLVVAVMVTTLMEVLVIPVKDMQEGEDHLLELLKPLEVVVELVVQVEQVLMVQLAVMVVLEFLLLFLVLLHTMQVEVGVLQIPVFPDLQVQVG